MNPFLLVEHVSSQRSRIHAQGESLQCALLPLFETSDIFICLSVFTVFVNALEQHLQSGEDIFLLDKIFSDL